MITNFSNKTFILKSSSKWVVVFLVYMILSRNPLLCINSMDLIPQINVRELMFYLIGGTLRIGCFGMSIAFVCVSLVNVFIEKCSILNNLYISDKFYKDSNNNDFRSSLHHLILSLKTI